MRGVAIAAGLLALASCADSDDAEEPAEEPAAQPDILSDPIPTEPVGWVAGAGGPGSESLGFSDGIGGMVLEMECLTDPARLQVRAPRLQPIESEERLTFGVGDRLVAMVAQPGATLGGGGGVVAEAPLDAELVAALSGGDFAASYGAEVIEIEDVPSDEALTIFANGCEAALAAGAADGEATDN